VLDRARVYVEHETPSAHAPGLVRLSALIGAELVAIGADVESIDAPGFGRNLRARIRGLDRAMRSLVLLGHIDTVHPLGTLAVRPFRVAGGRAEGPGIYDMKTGVALMVEALRIVRERDTGPRRPVVLLITCDEEIGSHSARPLIEAEANDAAAALVPEPCMPDGAVKTGRKGVATYRIDVRGIAGHAGTHPTAGASAITEIAHQIGRIVALADPSRGTTVNVGLVHGGTASNVIAGDAWATIDVRLREPAEGERIDRALRALTPQLAGTHVSVRMTESRGPLVRTEGVIALYHHARSIALELGVTLGEGMTGGGSDGSLIAAHGVPVLDGIGPRGGGAHAEDEHILVEDLPFRLALMVRLLETL
jgi:glutamate carboxypeptidase